MPEWILAANTRINMTFIGQKHALAGFDFKIIGFL
jgi:hypothetical protein